GSWFVAASTSRIDPTRNPNEMNVLILFVLVTVFGPPTLAEEIAKVPAHSSLPYPVWPIPRESSIRNERLLLTDAVIVVPAGDAHSQYPGRLLAELVADQCH